MAIESGKILVTGAGGFIGSRLTEKLIESGYRVRAFIRYNSAGRRGWLDESPCAGDIDFFHGDIRDFDAVYRAMDGCSAVFHLAALIGIPYSYLSPQAYLRTNIDGCFNVLEAARLRGPEKVIVTSTSEVYGSAQYAPMNEAHPVCCQSPYAATKAAADQLAFSYHRSFGLPVVVARPFNTYGPRQSARALIPSLLTQALAGAEVRIGNLYPARDFTFVDDVARGFIAIAGTARFAGEAVHIGTGNDVAVADLVRQISSLVGHEVTVRQDAERSRPASSEVSRLICDNTKIRSATNWRPEVGLESGLRKTMQWIEPRLSLYRTSEYAV